MASTENRGQTAREAVLTYCTSWTQAAYRVCWPDKGAGDATTEMMEETRLAVERELMAMLRHEIPASASEPTREPAVLQITGDLGSDSESDIMAGGFLGTYGELGIDTAGHWTYRAGETRLRELKENGPEWFIHYDRFFVTREDGSTQTLRIVLSRRRNDEVKETKAEMFVDDRVPAETFGENNEPDLRLAVERDLTRKLPDPDQFDEPAPVPLWVKGRPGDGMPRREVTQDELRDLRLYPERDELSGGGLRFVGLRFFNAAERLPVDETRETTEPKSQSRVPSLLDGKPLPKPPPPPKKRGGGLKRGRYYGPLERHLKWRKNKKDDLDTASLKELREDARSRLITDKVKDIPKTRSGLEDAIKAVLRDLGVNR